MDWSQSSQGKHNAFAWFTENQLQSVIRNGIIPEWFHGIISRKTAEELLMSKPPGYFLIRVSETRIGYTLSYRVEERCRHFMVDVLDDGQYVIVGESRRHQSLQDLVDFHRRTPILPCNQVLTVACGQSPKGHTNYAELLFPQKHPVSNASLQQSQPPPSSGHSESQGDVPPAVPYRPDNLMTPNSLQNRLYPRLEDEFQHNSSPLPPMPVPKIRRSHAADNPPLSNPPQVPARSYLPEGQRRAAPAPLGPRKTVPAEQNLGNYSHVHSVKNQEAKPSVMANLKNLKKKFQKKTNAPQDNEYAEIQMESGSGGGDTENEYEEIAEEQTFRGAHADHTSLTRTEQALPEEYMPPPPFAPGY